MKIMELSKQIAKDIDQRRIDSIVKSREYIELAKKADKLWKELNGLRAVAYAYGRDLKTILNRDPLDEEALKDMKIDVERIMEQQQKAQTVLETTHVLLI